jgi:soluble lytic murein transglycosylase-like protein
LLILLHKNHLVSLILLFASSFSHAQEMPDDAFRQAMLEAIEDDSSFEDRFDAEVWLMDMSSRLKSRMKDPDARLEFLKLVHREAKRADIPPELVLAVIQVESNFDQFALSVVGARGYMQVMPFWLNELGHPEDNLLDSKTNLRYGCTILKQYMKREKGNLNRALGRYNGSLGKRKYPDKVFKALRNRWFKS